MILRSAVAIAALLAVTAPAQASWLACIATASDANGVLEFHTTVADVGAVAAPRLGHLQQRLLAEVAQLNPDAQGAQAQCKPFDDQLVATSYYSRSLNAASQRLGWNRITIVAPESWLAETDIVSDPSHP